MKTNIYIRTLINYLVLFFLLVSCKPADNPDYGPIATTIAGQAEAAALIGKNDLRSAAPALWAINTAATVITQDTFMVINKTQEIAIFVAQGGTATNGSPYTFIGFINTAHNYLMEPANAVAKLGIDLNNFKSLTELKTALKNNGFIELTEKTAPTLLATIRLAMGYLKTVGVGLTQTLGGTISDILIIPQGILTPDYFSPWCDGVEPGCLHIDS